MAQVTKTAYYRTCKADTLPKSLCAKRREYLASLMRGTFFEPHADLKIEHSQEEIMKRAEAAYEALGRAVKDVVDELCRGAAIGDHVALNRLYVVFYPTVKKTGFSVKSQGSYTQKNRLSCGSVTLRR